MKWDEDQKNRFEFFFRSHFSRSAVKKIIEDVSKKTNITDDIGIAVASLAKLYVGELIESGSFRNCILIIWFL